MALPTHTDPARYWLQHRDRLDTEVVVSWIEEASAYTSTAIEYRERGGGGAWTEAAGTSVDHPFTGGDSGNTYRLVHHVYLSGLTPATEYEWRFTDPSGPGGEVRWFRTVAGEASGVRFGTGGDLYVGANANTMAAVVGARDLDFFVLNGDWAYADGLSTGFARWEQVWDNLTGSLTRDDGRVIPLVPGIGNHELTGGYADDKSLAPYFYAYFDFPAEHQGAYKVLRAGSGATGLAILILDSEHTSGEYSDTQPQMVWLEATLADLATEGVRHVYPFHHVAVWPGGRDATSAQHVRGRAHLWPRYLAGGVRTAFGAHDHVYCRTRRVTVDPSDPGDLALASVDDDGIVELGDGSMGAARRAGDQAGQWYVEEVNGTTHGDDTRDLHIYDCRLVGESSILAESVASSGEAWHTYMDGDEITAPTVTSVTPGPSRVVLRLEEVPYATGYRVRWGTESGIYTEMRDVAASDTLVVSGLAAEETFFVVSALYPIEGPLSTEVGASVLPGSLLRVGGAWVGASVRVRAGGAWV